MLQEIPHRNSPESACLNNVRQNFLAAYNDPNLSQMALPIVVIDFEASCLPCVGSYPIEVGVSFVTTGESLSWIIRPTDIWLRQGQWNDAAEALHGLSQERIFADGLPVDRVKFELADAVAGHFVVSDAATIDGYWLEMLFHGMADFSIDSVSDALLQYETPLHTFTQSQVDCAKLVAATRFPDRHRARSDSRRVAEAMRILLGYGQDDDPVSLVA